MYFTYGPVVCLLVLHGLHLSLVCIVGVTINRHHEDVEDATIVSFDCSKHNIGPKLEGLWDRSNPDLDRPRCRGQAVVIGKLGPSSFVQ